MKKTLIAWALTALLSPSLHAADLRVVVDGSTELPWAEIDGGEVIGGIQFYLGQAIAARLGRSARFIVLPRKRLASALEQGQADVICVMQPAWLAGPFDWSRAVLPNAELVVSLQSTQRPLDVSALAGITVGTVSGFHYPELEQSLSAGFVREDAPNAGANLRKLGIGRIQHASASQQFVDYQRRIGQLSVALHPYLVLSSVPTQCARSRRSPVSLLALDLVLSSLAADGTIHAVFARFK